VKRESKEDIFDDLLIKKDFDGAYVWAQEVVDQSPCNPIYKGFLVFALLMKGKWFEAQEMAEKVLVLCPYNEWALAVLFFLSNYSGIEANPVFLGPNGFCLRAVWHGRFLKLGYLQPAKNVWRFISKHGPEKEKQLLLQDLYGAEK